MRLPDLLSRGVQASAIAECLFDDETDGVALLDTQGFVQRANQRFVQLSGAGEGQLAWTALPPQSATRLGDALRAHRPETVTTTVMRGNVRRVLRLACLAIPDHGALLRVSDYTHEQDLEEQLCQSQRLQAVGELAGGIAHDFNNLLTAILGATDDLRTRSDRPADRDDLTQIRQSAERGATLVRHLLAFSRQQTLQPRVVVLNDEIRQTYALLHRLIGARVELELQLEEPSRQVRIDPTQLSQVLMNLAVNARNAMPNGGRLLISTGHRLMLHPEPFGGELLPAGRYASLSVADTGMGIPPDVLPRIFEPFFTTRRDSDGNGLGLSTVHGIIKQSGGYMAVETTLGQGTRFDILLPRHEDQAVWQAASDPAPTRPARPPVSRTLLLVDDEGAVRRLAERVLIRSGWNVVAAPSAEDALELVEGGGLGEALGCVVSDVMMPGMDGPALVGRLRRIWPSLPAVLMSGYSDASLRESLTASDIRFIPKPFAMSDLTRTLSDMLHEPAG